VVILKEPATTQRVGLLTESYKNTGYVLTYRPTESDSGSAPGSFRLFFFFFLKKKEENSERAKRQREKKLKPLLLTKSKIFPIVSGFCISLSFLIYQLKKCKKTNKTPVVISAEKQIKDT
jgi:hypothetical protein